MTAETAKLRRPCSSCPWRVDASRSYWDPQHFVDIWRTCQDDGLNVMLCHKSNARPKRDHGSIPCQGWIRVMGFGAIGVRLLVMRGGATHEEVEDRDGPTLFLTFEAMIPPRSKWLPEHSSKKP